jgi:hypothetical protein
MKGLTERENHRLFQLNQVKYAILSAKDERHFKFKKHQNLHSNINITALYWILRLLKDENNLRYENNPEIVTYYNKKAIV